MKNGIRSLVLLSPHTHERVLLDTGRTACVLVVVHSDRCDACREYVQDLCDQRPQLFEWGERLIVVVRDPSEDPPDFDRTNLDVFIESEEKLSFSGTGVIVTDEWGDIFHATAGHHRFLSSTALAEWLRFIAMQCPECEQPEGPWREIQTHSDS
jgi:hypothetical protein